MKPILFNTEMVKAILEGRKTVTRRVNKDANKYTIPLSEFIDFDRGTYAVKGINEEGEQQYLVERELPYKPGDILYVRETWCQYDKDHILDDVKYAYKADATADSERCRQDYGYKWHPSIHMPKAAARIWLKVTDVRVERLQDITPAEVVKEGVYEDCRECLESYSESGTQCCYKQDDECSQCDSVITEFKKLWNATIKQSDLDRYGWNANPWVWVIEFERCEKPEEKP